MLSGDIVEDRKNVRTVGDGYIARNGVTDTTSEREGEGALLGTDFKSGRKSDHSSKRIYSSERTERNERSTSVLKRSTAPLLQGVY